MADRSVAIRLGVEGKADVKRDLSEIGDGGEAAAKRWASAYEKANAEIEAGLAKQRLAAEKLSAITPQTTTQQAYQAGASTNFTGSSARDSAAAFKELLAAEEQLDAKARQLTASLEPLRVAQERYDREVATATKLLDTDRITKDQHTAATTRAARELEEAKRALDGHTGSLGLNRAQFLTAESAVIRFSDSVMAGGSPLRAFALEAHKGAEVLSLDDGGMAGGLAKVRALLNPVVLGVAGVTTAVAIGVTTWYEYSQSVAKLDALSVGAGRFLGLTGEQLQDVAAQAAAAGNMTIGSARDIDGPHPRFRGCDG